MYLAVAKLGEKPTDGITDTNPEGLTSATGKWAGAFAARLKKGGLTCHVRAGDDYKKAMLEKHVWICAFMLTGALNGGITVGEVRCPVVLGMASSQMWLRSAVGSKRVTALDTLR